MNDSETIPQGPELRTATMSTLFASLEDGGGLGLERFGRIAFSPTHAITE